MIWILCTIWVTLVFISITLEQILSQLRKPDSTDNQEIVDELENIRYELRILNGEMRHNSEGNPMG
jgi:hypothetical protein